MKTKTTKLEKVHDLRVTYRGYDYEMDQKIVEFFKELGLHFWASGRDLETGVRDICFEFVKKDDIVIGKEYVSPYGICNQQRRHA